MTDRALLTVMGLFIAVSLSPVPAASAAEEQNRGTRDNATDVGIWKSYAPEGLRGEFDNYDPIGLISGALIHTDCSINYTDPDDGKVYCFNSATSLVYFENWPKTYARRAAEAFEKAKKGAGF